MPERAPQGIAGEYLRARLAELASSATRASSQPLADWALQRIQLSGRRFSFEGHEYLRGIYDDTAQHIVLCKAAQIGGTVWALLKALHACLNGLDVIYFFPTRTDVLEFSKSRVGPFLAGNPFLSSLMTDTDTAGLKRIANAHLYLRGMQSTVGMKSVPADMLVFDELDEATPEAKAMARERLGHSDYKRIIELSNPSLPDFGIDEVFQASDQRRWTLKCPACGAWTALDREFPQRLGQEVRVLRKGRGGRVVRACLKCQGELDLSQGEWVADFPGRETHGYLLSQLNSTKVDPGEILREFQTTRFPERFYNLKIGIPWADTQNRLDLATVLKQCGEHGLSTRDEGPCTMGVDTGRELHVVISGALDREQRQRRVIYAGVHQEFGELDELIGRFGVRTCVIDALPEIHATREFASRHPGVVWMCYFSEGQKGAPSWKEDQQIVQVQRTEALDLSRAEIREGDVALPRSSAVVRTMAEHLTHDAKQLIEDEQTGAQVYRYIRTGTNHFSMAFTYDSLAALHQWENRPSAGAAGSDDPEPYRGLYGELRGPMRGPIGHGWWP